MLDWKKQRLLIVAPHPDDEIFGCGGLMHRVKREGGEVYVLFVTVGQTKDFSKNGSSKTNERMEELQKTMDYLKVDGWRMAMPGNEYHLRLDDHAQAALIDEFERGEISLQQTKPTMVAVPADNDYNQDHRAVFRAMVTATRPAPPIFRSRQPIFLQYELPGTANWTTTQHALPHNFYVELSEEDMKAKVQALKFYKSQLKHPDVPLSVHGITTMAEMRGIQCGAKYAEAYAAKRVLV